MRTQKEDFSRKAIVQDSELVKLKQRNSDLTQQVRFIFVILIFYSYVYNRYSTVSRRTIAAYLNGLHDLKY